MNRPELYQKTVDILYQAYFNDTLMGGVCAACAVGNIVAANNHLKIDKTGLFFRDKNDNPIYAKWSNVFMTISGKQNVYPTLYSGCVRAEIDSTGYMWHELAKIEFAFEIGRQRFMADEDKMFNGLVSVLEVLKTIHEVTDGDLLTATNKRFTDHYKTKTVCDVKS